jgi:kynurenine formamidase
VVVAVTEYVDLTHEFHEGMPGFRMADGEGGFEEFSATIRPFSTHEETAPAYDGRSSFEITEVSFQTSIGTYVDAPGHRFPDGGDVADYALADLIAEGTVVDARGRDPGEAVGPSVLPPDEVMAGRAVLFAFGWDDHWGTEAYYEYPYVSGAVLDRLLEADVALVGVDTLNVDDHTNPDRPAHTRLLDAGIPIVENLCDLPAVAGRSFRFHAVPIPAVDAVAMPVRAFAALG